MTKKGKRSEEKQRVQQKTKLIPKENKFFKSKSQNIKEKKQVNTVKKMVPNIGFQKEYNKQNQFHKIIGKIEYNWFSLDAIIRIFSQKGGQNSLKPSKFTQYQKQISQKLLQVNEIISGKYCKVVEETFCHQVWIMKDEIVPREIIDYKIFNTNDKQIDDVMKKVVCFMGESRATELVLESDRNNFLLMFSHVTFRNLKVLTLKKKLHSLEPLEWMDCPNLASLTVSSYTVSNLKSLAKISAGVKLNSLSIKNISAPSFQQMSRVNTKKGSSLMLIPTLPSNFNSFHFGETIFIQDACQLTKAQTGWKFLSKNEKLHQNRIRQVRVIENMLKANSREVQWMMEDDMDSD